jgi:putative ABC transport system permease protein
MLRTVLRNLAGRKLRLITTSLAVLLGVAFMAGTLVLTDTIAKTLDDLFTDVYENTDAVVRGEAAFEDPNGFGDQRGRIDASLLGVVEAVDGVALAQTDVFGYAQLVDKNGDPVGNPQNGPPTVGADWPEYDELNPWRLVEGRAPEQDDEIVIDQEAAEKSGYRVGDTATVLVKGGPTPMRIIGIVTFGEASSAAGATFVIFTGEAAERLVAEPGKVDSISVVADQGVSQEELTERLAAALPDDVEAVTGQTITQESQDLIEQAMSFFNTFMLVFAIVALLVGGFMIFNSFFITVAQRTKENALMRAVGASKRQLLVGVLLEALAIGVIASLLGLGAGLVVAVGLRALIAAMGFDLPTGGIVFTAGSAITAFVAGVVVTLVAAVSPARKAGKVAPVAAMRDVDASSSGYGSKERVIVGVAVMAAGIALLFLGLFGDASNALAYVGLGALVVFFAVTILGRTIALPLSRVIGWPLPHLRGITGELARENAMRNPKRTAATASALMIGVGLVTFFTIFATSVKASFSDTIDEVFQGDFVLSSPAGFGAGGLDPSLADSIDDLPEVGTVARIRAGYAEIAGDPTELIAADDGGFDIVDVQPVSGSPDDLDATTIAVHEDVAADKGLSVGDTVPVVFRDTGARDLQVALIYSEKEPAGDWVLGLEAFEANFADQYDMQVYVTTASGVSDDAALAAVERVADGYPGADVLDQTEFKDEQMAFVDQLLGLVYAMLALAIVIALLGIANTLALSIIERTRELGVMRAVGMTRAQLRAIIRWESVIIAVQGTLLGLAVGTFFGWALVTALAEEGLRTFAVPYATLAVVVVLAALAGVLAAVWPARRAARLNVLDALVAT